MVNNATAVKCVANCSKMCSVRVISPDNVLQNVMLLLKCVKC